MPQHSLVIKAKERVAARAAKKAAQQQPGASKVPGPKRKPADKSASSGGGGADAVALAAAKQAVEEAAAGGKIGKNSMQAISALLLLSLAARIRALESMAVWTYKIITDDPYAMFDTMGAIGSEHQSSIVEAKKSGETYTSEAPIHIVMWSGVVDLFRDTIVDLGQYLDTISNDSYSQVIKEVKYFRRIRCYEKKIQDWW